MAERFMSVASYALQAVDTLATVWRSSVSGYVKKIRALKDCIEAYGTQRGVQSELLFTLCTGPERAS